MLFENNVLKKQIFKTNCNKNVCKKNIVFLKFKKTWSHSPLSAPSRPAADIGGKEDDDDEPVKKQPVGNFLRVF